MKKIFPLLSNKQLALNSRQIKSGDIFIAIKGSQSDGNDYIADAINNGASLILSDRLKVDSVQNIPVKFIPNLKEKLSNIAEYCYPLAGLNIPIVGVTGTNGKSSVCHFIAQLLTHMNIKTAVMGTIGNGIWGNLKSSPLTTADIFSIQKNINDFVSQGAQCVAMEVSSHALVQNRVANVPFTSAVFTNLSRDHLDYHKTMAEYAAAKFKLFVKFGLKQAVINHDSDYAAKLYPLISENIKIISYSLNGQTAANFSCKKISVKNYQTQVELMTPEGVHDITVPLLGHFNIENVVASISTLYGLGYSLSEIISSVKFLKPVRGRFESIKVDNKPLVLIDYAHTPDALINVLRAAKKLTKNKLWCLFGCGGDRDIGKRPQMATAVEQYADGIIVTSDNPRTEDPGQIIDDVMQGFEAREKVIVEQDRKQAIKAAIMKAGSDDVIVIAGKGHEDYQEINKQRIPLCDKTIALKFLLENESCS